MNDLSKLNSVKFFSASSDYKNCFDISSEGFSEGIRVRHFLARIDKNDILKLIIALQNSLKES